MPTYSIKAPNGKTYSLDGPAGASQEDVQAEVLRQHPDAGAAAEDAAPQTIAGNLDASRQNVEGARQALVSGVQEAAQRVPEFIERLQALSTNTVASVTEKQSERRVVAEEVSKQAGINPEGRDAVVKVLESAPWFAAGAFGPLSRARTLGGALLKNTALSAAEAATQFDTGQGRLNDVVAASALTASVTAGTAALPAAANVVVGGVRQIVKGSRAEKVYEEATKEFGQFMATLGQRTGIPFIRYFESQSYNSKLQEFYAKQSEQIVDDAAKVLKQPSLSPTSTLEGQFLAARFKMQSSIDNMKGVRNKEWENGAREVSRAAKQGIGAGQIQMPTFMDAAAEVVSQSRNPLRNMARDVLPLRVARTLESKVLGRKPLAYGTLSAQEASDALVGINKLLNSADGEAQVLGGKLMDALYKDIQNMASSQGGGARDAANALLRMRDDYARRSMAIVAMQDGATYRMLGMHLNDGAIPEPGKLLEKLSTMSPGRVAEVRQWMAANSPETLKQMRQSLVDNAVRRAGALKASSDAQLDLDQFANALMNPKEGMAVRGLDLFTPSEQSRLRGISKALSIIKGSRPEATVPGTKIQGADVAGYVVSGVKGLVVRQIGRILTGVKGADFITDPEVYKKLLTYANTRGKTQDVARVALTDWLHDEYPVQPEHQQQPAGQ